MLKKIYLGKQEIPVPLPLNNLWEAVGWIETVLMSQGAALTKLNLNGRDVLSLSAKQKKTLTLNNTARLEVQIDSPQELCLQTLDAIKDLAWAMERRLQAIAVTCWQQNSDQFIQEVEDTAKDLRLLLNLIAHVNGMVDYSHKEMAPVNGLGRLILRPLADLEAYCQSADWKACAHILLNRLEPLLKELIQESDTLHLNMLSSAHSSHHGSQSPNSTLDYAQGDFVPHL